MKRDIYHRVATILWAAKGFQPVDNHDGVAAIQKRIMSIYDLRAIRLIHKALTEITTRILAGR